MSESDANRALSDTARLRVMTDQQLRRSIQFGRDPCPIRDPLEDTQRMDVHDRRRRLREAVEAPRERRKPATVGARQAASHARDVFADRQQELIEAGIWPRYEP